MSLIIALLGPSTVAAAAQRPMGSADAWPDGAQQRAGDGEPIAPVQARGARDASNASVENDPAPAAAAARQAASEAPAGDVAQHPATRGADVGSVDPAAARDWAGGHPDTDARDAHPAPSEEARVDGHAAAAASEQAAPADADAGERGDVEQDVIVMRARAGADGARGELRLHRATAGELSRARRATAGEARATASERARARTVNAGEPAGGQADAGDLSPPAASAIALGPADGAPPSARWRTSAAALTSADAAREDSDWSDREDSDSPALDALLPASARALAPDESSEPAPGLASEPASPGFSGPARATIARGNEAPPMQLTAAIARPALHVRAGHAARRLAPPAISAPASSAVKTAVDVQLSGSSGATAPLLAVAAGADASLRTRHDARSARSRSEASKRRAPGAPSRAPLGNLDLASTTAAVASASASATSGSSPDASVPAAWLIAGSGVWLVVHHRARVARSLLWAARLERPG